MNFKLTKYVLCLYLKSDVTFYGISENEVKWNTQKEHTETVSYIPARTGGLGCSGKDSLYAFIKDILSGML